MDVKTKSQIEYKLLEKYTARFLIHNREVLDFVINTTAKQLAIQGVGCSLPSKKIIDYLERSEDFYIDDSEIANRFYNAALNDVKYFIEKEEKKLK